MSTAVTGTAKGSEQGGASKTAVVVTALALFSMSVSYTHLTLPTNREV